MPCVHCNGFYSALEDQPVCPVCHSFLYQFQCTALKWDDEDGDSGTEEEAAAAAAAASGPSSGSEEEARQEFRQLSQKQQKQIMQQQQQTLLTSSEPGRGASLDSLPTELILAVLAHCDDMTVWALLTLGNRRITQIIEREFSDAYWQRQLTHRWPLFSLRRPLNSWRSLYSELLLSAPCLACLSCGPSSWDADEASSWRQRRLRLEYRSLMQEPPYGVSAVPVPVDSGRLSQWQAVICGPPGSPYEGGAFFLSLTVPHSYPLRPPQIRFLTKVFHPNVSRHGDVGLDAILPTNWSLALTLAKVLVCVQSLLTDPYTQVSMEPAIAKLCLENRPEFERMARLWTWKYAMHDFVRPVTEQLSNKNNCYSDL